MLKLSVERQGRTDEELQERLTHLVNNNNLGDISHFTFTEEKGTVHLLTEVVMPRYEGI